MTLQDKYKRANSRRYRATHGGIESNRAKARDKPTDTPALAEFPALGTQGGPANGQDSEDAEAEPGEGEPGFRRREIGSNASRYDEPEPEPDAEPEPEVDLRGFLEKQRTALDTGADRGPGNEGEEDVDTSFDHLFRHSHAPHAASSKPSKIVVDGPAALGLPELDDLRKKADATRDLLARFAGRSSPASSASKLRTKTKTPQAHQARSKPADLVGPLDDEAFLDEVLNDSSGTYGKFKRA